MGKQETETNKNRRKRLKQTRKIKEKLKEKIETKVRGIVIDIWDDIELIKEKNHK